MKVRAIFLGILALAPASGACKKKGRIAKLARLGIRWDAGRPVGASRPRSAEVARVSS